MYCAEPLTRWIARSLPLFERRMAVTQQVGEYKQAHDIPVLDARRERQVIANKLECLQIRICARM